MVQVENEVGYLGPGRDRSPEANRLFRGRVPDALLRALVAKRAQLSPELASHFNEHGENWAEVFGNAANEVFMAWNYASYIEAVTHAGKSEYALREDPCYRRWGHAHPSIVSGRILPRGQWPHRQLRA